MRVHSCGCGFAIPAALGTTCLDGILSVFWNFGMKNRWAHWITAILLWSTLGVLFALPVLSSSNWSGALLGSLAQWWSWGLVTPLILWTDARLPFKKNQLGMRILAHLPASVALTILYFYVFVAMRALLRLGLECAGEYTFL